MLELDALFLSRWQFAFTVSFHIILPSFTIGLASYLAVLEGLWLWRKDDVYLQLFRYWLKIFERQGGAEQFEIRNRISDENFGPGNLLE